MLTTLETLEAIWRNLEYDDKRELEKAMNLTSKDFCFEPKVVLKKYTFALPMKQPPEMVQNDFGGYLVWKITINEKKYMELIQTAMYGLSLWLYDSDMFPKKLWNHQEDPPLTIVHF